MKEGMRRFIIYPIQRAVYVIPILPTIPQHNASPCSPPLFVSLGRSSNEPASALASQGARPARQRCICIPDPHLASIPMHRPGGPARCVGGVCMRRERRRQVLARRILCLLCCLLIQPHQIHLPSVVWSGLADGEGWLDGLRLVGNRPGRRGHEKIGAQLISYPMPRRKEGSESGSQWGHTSIDWYSSLDNSRLPDLAFYARQQPRLLPPPSPPLRSQRHRTLATGRATATRTRKSPCMDGSVE